MNNFWLKIKIWTKIILAAILLIYALLFIAHNHGEPVHVWMWGWIDTTVLPLLLFTVVFSVVGTILVGTAFKTIRQVRELRERNRQAKITQHVEEMAAREERAAKLKTKPNATL